MARTRERRPDLLGPAATLTARPSGSTARRVRRVLYSAARSLRTRPSPRPSRSHGCPDESRNRRVTVLDEIVQDQLRTDLPELATGRHRQGVGQGRRGQPRAHPGLRGDRHAPARRRHHPLDHRPAHRVAASASSGRSRSTARASRRSRSSATASPAAPSSTSCAIASARPRPSASAARRAERRRPRPRPLADPRPRRPAGSLDSG